MKLAANERDGTFAVILGLPKHKGWGGLRSQILLFDLQHASPIFREMVDGAVAVLLSLQDWGKGGFVLVNEEAEVVYLRDMSRGAGSEEEMKQATSPKALEGPDSKTRWEELVAPWQRIEVDINAGGIGANGVQRAVAEGVEDEGLTHKTNSSLADVFGRSTQLPTRDLFEQVVGVLQGGR